MRQCRICLTERQTTNGCSHQYADTILGSCVVCNCMCAGRLRLYVWRTMMMNNCVVVVVAGVVTVHCAIVMFEIGMKHS